jgi:hypothetical protein
MPAQMVLPESELKSGSSAIDIRLKGAVKAANAALRALGPGRWGLVRGASLSLARAQSPAAQCPIWVSEQDVRSR